MNALIVEDEPKLANLLRDYLVSHKFSVTVCATGEGALAALRKEPPAVVLLDIGLPGMDGLAVCKEIRSFSTVPILFLTARVEDIDRIIGLELGGDDYICKPYNPREVVARVHAVLRRAAAANTAVPAIGPAATRQIADASTARASGTISVVRAGPLEIDPESMRVLWHSTATHASPGAEPSAAHVAEPSAAHVAQHAASQPAPHAGPAPGHRAVRVETTPVEFRILHALASAPTRVFSRKQLMQRVYDDDRVVTERTLDSHIKNLRRKCQEAAHAAGDSTENAGDVIEAVYGVGYRFQLPGA